MSCSPQQGSKENGSISISSLKETDSVCHRRKSAAEGKEDKKSWIDPPEEPTTVTLTQAEIESCMQTYEVFSFSETTCKSVSQLCNKS